MILIKKMQAPPELESLKKEAEKLGLSDKEGYDKLRNPLKSQVQGISYERARTSLRLLYAVEYRMSAY